MIDIKDVKPPVDIPGLPWLWWVLAAAIAAAIFFISRFWQKRNTRLAAAFIIKIPWELAHERLADLERRNLFAQGKVKEYFSELSDIIRRYIEDRFDIQAPEMTTEEFLNAVGDSVRVEKKHQEILKDFLNLSDMVKFAKYGPNVNEAAQSMVLAKRFVDETRERAALSD